MKQIRPTLFARYQSPVGLLLLTGISGALNSIQFDQDPHPDWIENEAPFDTALVQLFEYFEGRRTVFNLPLLPQGTPFQMQVWDQLQRIPYGQMISYKTLAERLGKPEAVRAVGAANGANPLPIVIPCHRVVGSGGDLVGFAGGLDRKRYLLDLESPSRRLF